jgi:hypothetical protein
MMLAAAIGGLVIGVIGFAMSYNTLEATALHQWGFSHRMAQLFPIGVDSSIIAFLAMDLYLLRKGIPWPALRFMAHVMTGATIWFNASSQGSFTADPVRSASHGIMPMLFVMGVDAGRRLIMQKARLEAGTATDRVPMHRWVLSPIRTPRFYRRMRLNSVTSYPEMVRRDQELIAYKMWLRRKYEGTDQEPTEDELLPMKMAPYGYTVAQALAMPAEQNRQAKQREEEELQRARDAETRQHVEQRAAEEKREQADNSLKIARFKMEGLTGQARAAAQQQVTAAERVAETEAAALETATTAEARARAARAGHEEAQERLAAAQADTQAVEAERLAAAKRRAVEKEAEIADLETRAVETAALAEARRRAAEADRAAAETKRAASETLLAAAETDGRAADERARTARLAQLEQEAILAAAETSRAAAETRRAASEIERAAVEAEDVAKLKPRERAVRKVARMLLLTPHQDPEELPLAEIMRVLEVSSAGTASEYRAEAAELLRTGYRP